MGDLRGEGRAVPSEGEEAEGYINLEGGERAVAVMAGEASRPRSPAPLLLAPRPRLAGAVDIVGHETAVPLLIFPRASLAVVASPRPRLFEEVVVYLLGQHGVRVAEAQRSPDEV